MGIDRDLQMAQERAFIGWDEDEARAVLTDSVQTIRSASRIARQAVEAQAELSDMASGDMSAFKNILHQWIDGGLSSARNSGTMTRSQARDMLNTLNRLERNLDVKELVRMSLDLTKQAQMFLRMMTSVDDRYGAQERERQEDLVSHLEHEQLMQVLEWVEANRRAGQSEVLR